MMLNLLQRNFISRNSNLIKVIYFILGFICGIFIDQLSAQSKYDYQWVFSNSARDAMVLNFNNEKISFDTGIADMYMHATSISMSNESGELIFYSNGCDIRGADHKILENGDQINPGEIHDEYCRNGYISAHQSMICIPHPGKKDVYYLFHQRLAWTPLPNSTIRVTDLFYSIVLKDRLRNKWIVTQKNQSLISGLMLPPANLVAVKHVNSKDWWLMSPVYEKPEYIRFLIREDSIYGPYYQTILDTFDVHQQSGVCFSPDGKKYAHFTQKDGLSVFDFDRNTGLLSNEKHVNLTGKYIYGGLAISPNSQFIYVCIIDRLYQFDLTANDLEKSKILIATFDGKATPRPPFYNYFVLAQLGPDCRI